MGKSKGLTTSRLFVDSERHVRHDLTADPADDHGRGAGDQQELAQLDAAVPEDGEEVAGPDQDLRGFEDVAFLIANLRESHEHSIKSLFLDVRSLKPVEKLMKNGCFRCGHQPSWRFGGR